LATVREEKESKPQGREVEPNYEILVSFAKFAKRDSKLTFSEGLTELGEKDRTEKEDARQRGFMGWDPDIHEEEISLLHKVDWGSWSSRGRKKVEKAGTKKGGQNEVKES